MARSSGTKRTPSPARAGGQALKRKTLTTAEWHAAQGKGAKTGRMANTLAKALAKRYAKRWRFVDFLGPKRAESAGIVDIVAIRKDGRSPAVSGLMRLDLFEIILIQVKGGTARGPSPDDIKRLQLVGSIYNATAIVLFEWRSKRKTGYSVLDSRGDWNATTAEKLFG